MRPEHIFIGPQIRFHISEFGIYSRRRIQQHDPVVSRGFVDVIERQRSSGGRALCRQRFGIDNQPASGNSRHECRLQRLGRHFGGALEDRRIRFMRRRRCILNRRDTRFLTR